MGSEYPQQQSACALGLSSLKYVFLQSNVMMKTPSGLAPKIGGSAGEYATRCPRHHRSRVELLKPALNDLCSLGIHGRRCRYAAMSVEGGIPPHDGSAFKKRGLTGDERPSDKLSNPHARGIVHAK